MLTIRRPNGTIELFEDQFLDQPWKLSDCDSELTEADFSEHFDSGQTGQVDVTTEGRLDIQFTRNLRRQLRLVGVEKGWDVYGLANWLNRQIPHPDIMAADSRLFMLRVVEGLLSNRSLKVEQLAQQKYRLREALTAKIEQYRRSQLRLAFQQVLFESGNAVVATAPEFCFHFHEGTYAPHWYYEPGYQFQKHFFPVVGELKSEGEEFDCAVFLDQLDGVSWWVRNVTNPRTAFWLQTSTDRFYPDFVAMLKDGRRLVVESKGEDRWSNDDSKEKRAIGELWAIASDGHCLFVMPNGPDWSSIRTKIATPFR